MSVVDELVTLLGLDIDPKAESTAYKFGAIIGGTIRAAAKLGAVLASVATAVQGYAAHQADAIDKEQELAATLGVSYDRFQELAYAAKLSGGDVQTLSADLEKLQENLLNPATGAQNKALTALGISARDASGKLKGADVIVGELAAKFDGLTAAEQNTYAKLLRISPATVRLLQNGEKGLADMAQEARDLGLILDKEAAQAAADFGDSLDRVKATAEGVGRSVIISLIPGLTKAVNGVTEWIKANRKLIASGIAQVVEGVALGFQMVGRAVSYVAELVTRFVPGLEDLTEGLDATQAIAVAVALAIGAVAVSVIAANLPVIALAAAITAVILVIEDLYAAFTGGESVIGGWVKSFQEAYPAISKVFGLIGDAIGVLAQLVGVTLVESFKQMAAVVEFVLGGLLNDVKVVLGWVEKMVAGVQSVAGKINLSSIGEAAAAEVPVPAELIAPAAGGNVTIAPNITVNGAGDPRAVGQEVVQRAGLGASLQQSRPGATGPVMG